MACDDRPVCISAFYLRIRGGGKVFILCLGYFFTLPPFSFVVSALDYSLLNVEINDDL